MRLGILGGTFDPPHIGHLIVAQDACAALQLDGVRFVPAALPPHKTTRTLSPAAVRFALVEAALAGDPRFLADGRELARAGPSYTVDTLRSLREELPESELVLLIGADQYAEFDKWHETAEIRRLAQVAVLTRDGAAGPLPALPDARIVHVAVTRIDISSTEVRRRVRAGEPIRYLVPAGVERQIREHGLYVEPAAPGGPGRTDGVATPP